jgi:hypothetical protein
VEVQTAIRRVTLNSKRVKGHQKERRPDQRSLVLEAGLALRADPLDLGQEGNQALIEDHLDPDREADLIPDVKVLDRGQKVVLHPDQSQDHKAVHDLEDLGQGQSQVHITALYQ